MSEIRLIVEDLSFAYDSVKALENISFKVEKGEFLGILGPNGSGKTTLLRCLSKVLGPKKGTVLLEGKDISLISLKTLASLIASVPSTLPTQFNLNVIDVVLIGRHPHSNGFRYWETDEDVKVALEKMKLLSINHLSQRKLWMLSDGERQKVLIAKALAQEPKLLLVDEPTSHLDIKHQIEIMKLLRTLTRKKVTIIAAMHDLNLAAWFCDKLLLLKEGKIYAAGEPQEVLKPKLIESVYGVKTTIVNIDSGKILVIPD